MTASEERTSAPTPRCPVSSEYRFSPAPLAAGTGHARLDEWADSAGPFFWAEEAQGYWVLTDHDLIRAALHDADLFSSSAIAPTNPDPDFRLIPLNLDGEEHTRWRKVLGRFFTPRQALSTEPQLRERARSLIAEVAGRGAIDFNVEVARVFPSLVFLHILGLPAEDLPRFLAWEASILHHPVGADEAAPTSAMLEVVGYLQQAIAERRTAGGEVGADVISQSLTWEIDGAPVSDDDLLACLVMLFIAGLDTVASQIGYIMHHLARHPDDRRRVVASPELVPEMVEELVRTYSIVSTARKATRDADFHGCPVRAGQMVALPLAAAGRDPKAHDGARTVDLDRTNARLRQLGFGYGRHLCLGAHLARLELTILLQEWHARVPDYRIPEGVELTEHLGAVFGIDSLPLEWDV